MKRLFLSLMMATAVLSGTFAQSEEKKTTFGVKAEMNSNFYLVGDSEIITATGNGFGANAGLFLKTNIIDNLAIRVELLCQYRNADFTILGQEHTLTNWGIEVPAYIMGQFGLLPENRCRSLQPKYHFPVRHGESHRTAPPEIERSLLLC